MANHKSAIKENRQAEKRRELNRQHRSRLRTAVKRFRKAVASGDTSSAQGLLTATLSLVDRSAKLGVIHDNAASRTKSRLTRALTRAATGA